MILTPRLTHVPLLAQEIGAVGAPAGQRVPSLEVVVPQGAAANVVGVDDVCEFLRKDTVELLSSPDT